ncbi:hypothetical protein Pfo_021237 [Paulownia fortunei]|nr:hypothetical protein Pfo_021237 [Paulownia fortunei]
MLLENYQTVRSKHTHTHTHTHKGPLIFQNLKKPSRNPLTLSLSLGFQILTAEVLSYVSLTPLSRLKFVIFVIALWNFLKKLRLLDASWVGFRL